MFGASLKMDDVESLLYVEQNEGIRIVKQWVMEKIFRERMFCWVIENQRFITVSKEAALAANDLSLATSRADSSTILLLWPSKHMPMYTWTTHFIHISCTFHAVCIEYLPIDTNKLNPHHISIGTFGSLAYSLHPSIVLRIFVTITSDIVIFVSHHSTNFGRFQSKSHFWESR